MRGSTFSNTRPLLSLEGIAPADIALLGDVAARYGRDPGELAGALDGARVGLVFTAPSTRTRVSFWSAATTLGCQAIHIGPADLQVNTGETWSDTGMVLANYLDAVVVRTNGPQHELEELSSRLPATINAVTYQEHPTQAIADLCALRDQFGSAEGLRVAYLGQVNNTARALSLLACKTPGMTIDLYSPAGLGHTDTEVTALNRLADRPAVRQFAEPPATPDPVDAVYTTRWQAMGAAHEPGWLDQFRPFAVTKEMMARFSGGSEAVFMHDLPAVREQEATSEVIDGPLSLVARQAYHKASAAAAALIWVLRVQS